MDITIDYSNHTTQYESQRMLKVNELTYLITYYYYSY